MSLNQGLPSAPIVDTKTGILTPVWQTFLLSILNRTGGINVTQNANDVLSIGPNGLPQWGTLSATGNEIYAGPADGQPGNATFRALVTADLDGVAGQFPGTTTNDNAAADNVGEYISSEIDSGAAVALSNATAADITSIVLTPGDWDAWGAVTTDPAASTTQSDIKAWINTQSATDPTPPNAGAYVELQTTIAAGLSQTLPTGSMRITVAEGGNQTVYLSTKTTFAISTLSAYGFLGARRRR